MLTLCKNAKSERQIRLFGFPFAEMPNEDVLKLYCHMFQKLAINSPPQFDGVQIMPHDIKVGYRKVEGHHTQLVIQLKISKINKTVFDESSKASHASTALAANWVVADFSQEEHCKMADKLDFDAWLRLQDGKVRDWLMKNTSSKKRKHHLAQASAHSSEQQSQISSEPGAAAKMPATQAHSASSHEFAQLQAAECQTSCVKRN